MVRYVRTPSKFEQDVKEFMVHIRADMTTLSHRVDNVGENLGILQNLTIAPVNEVSLMGRINKMEGSLIKLVQFEKDVKDRGWCLYSLGALRDEDTKLWDERNRIVSRLDMDEGNIRDLMGGVGFTDYEKLKSLENDVRLLQQNPFYKQYGAPPDYSILLDRISKLENETFIGKGRWIEQLEDRIRLVEEALAGLPLRVEKLEVQPSVFSADDCMKWVHQRMERLEAEDARVESLEWKFCGLEKRMEETLKVANPLKCDRCGKTFSPQAIKQTDEENVCMMCRIDVLEAMIWHKPSYEQKEESPYNPNDPLPGEEKYDYGARMGKMALRRWDELYGQK